MSNRFMKKGFLAAAVFALVLPTAAFAQRGEHGGGHGGGRNFSSRGFSGGGRSFNGGGRSFNGGDRGFRGGGHFEGRREFRGRDFDHDRFRGGGFYFGYGAPYYYGYAPGYSYDPACGYYDQWGYWHPYPGCYADPYPYPY